MSLGKRLLTAILCQISCFGNNHRVRVLRDDAAEELLGSTIPVYVRGVEQPDARIECCRQSVDGRPSGDRSIRLPTEGPSAEANGAHNVSEKERMFRSRQNHTQIVDPLADFGNPPLLPKSLYEIGRAHV